MNIGEGKWSSAFLSSDDAVNWLVAWFFYCTEAIRRFVAQTVGPSKSCLMSAVRTARSQLGRNRPAPEPPPLAGGVETLPLVVSQQQREIQWSQCYQQQQDRYQPKEAAITRKEQRLLFCRSRKSNILLRVCTKKTTTAILTSGIESRGHSRGIVAHIETKNEGGQ